MSQTPKQKHYTAEELLQQAQEKAEEDRVHALAKNEIWSFLVNRSKSIEDAEVVCQTMSSAIKALFNKRMISTLLSELKMEDTFNTAKEHVEDVARYRELLTLLEKENIATALRILEDGPTVIRNLINIEMKTRPLSTLKTNFPDDKAKTD